MLRTKCTPSSLHGQRHPAAVTELPGPAGDRQERAPLQKAAVSFASSENSRTRGSGDSVPRGQMRKPGLCTAGRSQVTCQRQLWERRAGLGSRPDPGHHMTQSSASGPGVGALFLAAHGSQVLAASSAEAPAGPAQRPASPLQPGRARPSCCPPPPEEVAGGSISEPSPLGLPECSAAGNGTGQKMGRLGPPGGA